MPAGDVADFVGEDADYLTWCLSFHQQATVNKNFLTTGDKGI